MDFSNLTRLSAFDAGCGMKSGNSPSVRTTIAERLWLLGCSGASLNNLSSASSGMPMSNGSGSSGKDMTCSGGRADKCVEGLLGRSPSVDTRPGCMLCTLYLCGCCSDRCGALCGNSDCRGPTREDNGSAWFGLKPFSTSDKLGLRLLCGRAQNCGAGGPPGGPPARASRSCSLSADTCASPLDRVGCFSPGGAPTGDCLSKPGSGTPHLAVSFSWPSRFARRGGSKSITGSSGSVRAWPIGGLVGASQQSGLKTGSSGLVKTRCGC
mmetsp:Transcript_97404/g.225806  ORF Transcript_97404/g.225806 Transcript_97404/m.225806 type:complete len:267 (+) Transcript_97404:323-1123(+)